MQHNTTALPGTAKDPDALLRTLVVTAIISMFVIVSLTGYGIFRVYEHYIMRDAENEAISIGQALYELEKDLLLAANPGGTTRLAVDPRHVQSLDARLKQFLHPFGIVKIKIYSADQKVIYSTEGGIIGMVDTHNVRLKRALTGVNDSKLEKKEEVKDLVDERKFDVDVVETYIPISDGAGTVIGSFEIYIDVTKYRREIGEAVIASTAIVGIVLVIVFGLSFILVKKGTNELKKTQQVLERLSITDSLTGILNQRHILSRAKGEFSKLRRSGGDLAAASLGFIMIDIDHFKTINDSYGHLAGDAVLQQLAERMVRTVRDYDDVGRYGGEEFLVIVPNVDLDRLHRAAQRIREAIREAPFRFEDATIHVTASVGITCVAADDADYAAALKRADTALYGAKQAGRDRIATG